MLMMAVPAQAEREHYAVSVSGNYGFNTTWGHYGGAELRAYLPIVDNFRMWVNTEAVSAEVYTVGVNCQPYFDLPTGKLFLDGSMLSATYLRNRVESFAMAASLGYEMDYVTVQVGMHSLVSADMDVKWHDEANYVVEPFNLLYKVDVRVRPSKSVWNLHFGAANFTELEYERMWQPMAFFGAHYDLPYYNFGHRSDDMQGNVRHLRVFAELIVKPTGMFHLDASFYGAKAKVGLMYRF